MTLLEWKVYFERKTILSKSLKVNYFKKLKIIIYQLFLTVTIEKSLRFMESDFFMLKLEEKKKGVSNPI